MEGLKKKIGSLVFVCMALMLCAACASSGGDRGGQDYSKEVVGTWKIYGSVPNGDFKNYNSEFIFNADGTMLEKSDAPNTPGALKWGIVDNDIIVMSLGDKKTYMFIEKYASLKNISMRGQFDKLNRVGKMKALKGLYFRYPEGSAYYNFLKILYSSPSDKVDFYRTRMNLREAVYKAVREGYVVVKDYDGLMAVFNEEQKQKEASEKLADEQYKQHMKDITRKWGTKVARAIDKNEVFIGMTAEQVLESLNEPNEKNTVQNQRGTFEQWTYSDGRSLYFLNNRLHTMQKMGN